MDAVERLRGISKEEVCRLLITRTLEKSGEDRNRGMPGMHPGCSRDAAGI